MNQEQLQTQVKLAYGALYKYEDRAFLAGRDLATAKQLLADARAKVLLSTEDPKALGGNEAAREAKLNDMCASEVAAVRTCDNEEKASGHLLRMAQMGVDEVRCYVRIFTPYEPI